jgi:hypothetical protein
MKTPDTTKAMPSAPSKRKFTGPLGPRQERAVAALLRRPVPREQLDDVTGQSNSPELVAELRRQGLEVPCLRVPTTDRDGRIRQPGVYHLTANEPRQIHQAGRVAPAPAPGATA